MFCVGQVLGQWRKGGGGLSVLPLGDPADLYANRPPPPPVISRQRAACELLLRSRRWNVFIRRRRRPFRSSLSVPGGNTKRQKQTKPKGGKEAIERQRAGRYVDRLPARPRAGRQALPGWPHKQEHLTFLLQIKKETDRRRRRNILLLLLSTPNMWRLLTFSFLPLLGPIVFPGVVRVGAPHSFPLRQV